MFDRIIGAVVWRTNCRTRVKQLGGLGGGDNCNNPVGRVRRGRREVMGFWIHFAVKVVEFPDR